MSDQQLMDGRILTLQILVEAILEELVENKTIDRDAFDERINKKVETLNKIAKKLEELEGNTKNEEYSLSGFMKNIVIGEA